MKKWKASRQTSALKRLRDQLTSDEKTEKKGFNKLPLTEDDKKRIRKEIKTLEEKV
jgi:hypothetical protein